jgi:transposase
VADIRGRPLVIDWQDDADELFRRYRQEKGPYLRTRWHGLWLVRSGHTLRQAARLVGVDERSMRRWVGWYRRGGLVEVAKHHWGGQQGAPSRLSPQQRAALEQETAKGSFRTIVEAIVWVQEQFGVRYTYGGMQSLFSRMRFKKKVPRPLGAKADLEIQEAWKKGGFPRS